MTIRTVVLVDDHPIVRDGLTALFDAEGSYRVVAQAGTAREAEAMIEEHRPALAVVDLMLDDETSVPLVKLLATRFPSTKTLCVSMHNEAAYGELVARAGASGFVTKAQAGRAIIDAANAVLAGRLYFTADTIKRAMGQGAERSPNATPGVDLLTARELQILQLVGAGLTKQLIADRIERSANTVEAHRSNIKRKLGLSSNAELLRFSLLHFPQKAT